MEKELDAVIGAPRSQFVQINIAAAICMAVIILGVLGVKYFSPSAFSQMKEWYDVYVLDETSPEEVLNGVETDEV